MRATNDSQYQMSNPKQASPYEAPPKEQQGSQPVAPRDSLLPFPFYDRSYPINRTKRTAYKNPSPCPENRFFSPCASFTIAAAVNVSIAPPLRDSTPTYAD